MNLKDFQKIEKEGNSEYGIDIYKKDFSIKTKSDNVNRINIEKEIINEKGTNKQIILSENKSRRRSGIMHNIEGKINVQYLDFKNLKYQDDASPSSARNLNKIQNEEEVVLDDIEFKKNNNKNDLYNNMRNNEIKDKKNKDEAYIDDLSTESNFIEKEKEPEDLFKKVISIDLNIKICNEELKLFFFNQIPKGETLISNININTENKENNFSFNYNLEIFRNNKIYFFAKIVKYFPKMKIKIYYSDNYNYINKEHYSQISNVKIKNNFNLIYVGKIISNMMRTNFVVYSGNKKNNYIKNLDINYSINFFGLLGLREMKVNKYFNNNISVSWCNYKPEWDSQYNNYKMNFNGRVKQTSKKNFILVENINLNNLHKNKVINKNYEN